MAERTWKEADRYGITEMIGADGTRLGCIGVVGGDWCALVEWRSAGAINETVQFDLPDERSARAWVEANAVQAVEGGTVDG